MQSLQLVMFRPAAPLLPLPAALHTGRCCGLTGPVTAVQPEFRDCMHKFTGQMPPPYFSNGRSLPGTCRAESKAWAWQQMPHAQPLQRSSTGLTADAVHTASTTLFLLGLTAAAMHTAVAALFLQAGQQLP